MVYSTSRCPSCGQVIRNQTNLVKEIGIPFERCRHCGTTYLNSYKEEWITMSPPSRFLYFLQAGVWARAVVIPVFMLILPITVFDLSSAVVWALWPLLSLTWLIVGYFLHKKAAQDDIAASLERTRNPEYLSLLEEAGYAIYPIEDTANSPYTNSPIATEKRVTCPKCEQALPAGSLFCCYCGVSLTAPISASNPASTLSAHKEIQVSHTPSPRKNMCKPIFIAVIIAIVLALTIGIIAVWVSTSDGTDSNGERPATIYNVAVRTISLSDKITAEFVLGLWKNGKATEQTMTEIMDEFGAWQGGGKLYVIERGDFVEEIDAWCFSEQRKVGDYAIIENVYGYTICYISGFNEDV